MQVCPKCGGQYPVEAGFCPMDGARLQAPAPVRAASGSGGTSRSSDADDLLGQVLDRRYRLDELIGRGGMGYVFRATHTLIGKTLAIKLLRPEHLGDPAVLRRFLREANIASAIKHPNVVDISDYGELPDGGAYYVMEYLRGRTLASRIDGEGPLPPRIALGVALQICSGLDAAHREGIVHRDLKPDNVFLCRGTGDAEFTRVKLFDFGIARAEANRITLAGAVLGTPEYMSPEQARGSSDIDARADLYALGVMLFEMLTGLVPFCSEDVTKVLFSHIHGQPPSLVDVAPKLEPLARTNDAIAQLLAKAPSDRPASAEAAAALLCAAMEADLGNETAERVTRATLAIGSGGISSRGPLGEPTTPPQAAPAWPGRDVASDLQDRAPETSSPAPKVPFAVIVSGTALATVALTIGVFLWGFAPERESAAPAGDSEAPRGSEIHSGAPVGTSGPTRSASAAEPAPGQMQRAVVIDPQPVPSPEVGRPAESLTPTVAESKASRERSKPKRPSGTRSGSNAAKSSRSGATTTTASETDPPARPSKSSSSDEPGSSDPGSGRRTPGDLKDPFPSN